MIVLQTHRLILRHFEMADARALERLFADPAVMRYGDSTKSPQWVREWVRSYVHQHYSKWGFGMWAVVEKGSHQVIGYCGLSGFPDRCGPDETELGYRLMRKSWGYGYATEAATAVRDHAFGKLRLRRLTAIIDPHNIASIRVAEKVGLVYERDVMFERYSYPDRVYAIAARDD